MKVFLLIKPQFEYQISCSMPFFDTVADRLVGFCNNLL